LRATFIGARMVYGTELWQVGFIFFCVDMEMRNSS